MNFPTPLHLLIAFVFAIGTINFFCMFILFVKAKDGRLRLHLIKLFATLCWSYGVRASQQILIGTFDIPQEAVELMIGVPLLFTTTWFVIFLVKKYQTSSDNNINW